MTESATTATCAGCRTVAAPPPISWMRQNDQRRGTQWYCAACAREHLRAIEARLEREWW